MLNKITLSLLVAAYCLAILSSQQADAFSIKGHARPTEDKSVKGAQQQQSETKTSEQVKSVAGVAASSLKSPAAIGAAQAQSAPVLESSKKVYNDESIRGRAIRRSAHSVASAAEPAASYIEQQQLAVPSGPVAVPAASPVAPVVEPVAVPVAVAVAVPVALAAPVAEPKIEHVQPVAEAAAAPVAPVAPIVPVVVEPVAVSERSAAPKQAVVEPVVASVAAPVVEAKVSNVAPVPLVEKQIQPAQLVPVAAAPVSARVVAASAPVVAAPAPVVPAPAESVLEAKKDEQQAAHSSHAHSHSHAEPLPEVPAPDPQLVLSEPIDSTTKLLIDLDEHVQKFLPQEDKEQANKLPVQDPSLIAGVDFSPADPKGKSAPLQPYSGIGVSESDSIVPPLPALDSVEKSSGAASGVVGQASPASSIASPSGSTSVQAQPSSASRQGNNNHQNQNQQQVITQLMDQLDSLQNRIQDTINQLVARRRYVMSALLRPMGTYVRRVRTNLERLQNRVNQLQAAASSVGSGANRPGGFVDAAAIETIRRRIDDISKRISDIVNRIRFSLTPTSAPLGSSNGRK